MGVNNFIQFIGDPIECKPSSESQISEKMFEFHCWIHGTYHRGDKNGRIEGRLCVKNYVIFILDSSFLELHPKIMNSKFYY